MAIKAAEARKKREEENKLKLRQRQQAPKKTNNFLLVENIPKKATETSLKMLFKEFPGFKWVHYLTSGISSWVRETA